MCSERHNADNQASRRHEHHAAMAHACASPDGWVSADQSFEPNDDDTSPKTMVLMRGLPSCGKSHTSQALVAEGGVRFEFDEYFYTEVGDDATRYDWSSDLMPDARQWNLNRIRRATDAGVNPVIVDSDNNVDSFTKQYVAYALDRGYELTFKEPESTWWATIRQLLRDKKTNAAPLRGWAQALMQMSKRTHRVPLQNILHRMERWEDVSTEKIMAVV